MTPLECFRVLCRADEHGRGTSEPPQWFIWQYIYAQSRAAQKFAAADALSPEMPVFTPEKSAISPFRNTPFRLHVSRQREKRQHQILDIFQMFTSCHITLLLFSFSALLSMPRRQILITPYLTPRLAARYCFFSRCFFIFAFMLFFIALSAFSFYYYFMAFFLPFHYCLAMLPLRSMPAAHLPPCSPPRGYSFAGLCILRNAPGFQQLPSLPIIDIRIPIIP